MLDKSVPFIDVLMYRKAGTPVPVYPLPEGYSFSLFQPDDEKEWAEIETSVLEFKRSVDALVYFQKNYMCALPELQRRCLFVNDPAGKKVATSTIWWEYTGQRRDPWVSWVSVRPDYQGHGLGKAIISKVLRLGIEIEGDRDFYLKTQTWSHKAITIYEKIGFSITAEKNLWRYTNENYEKAIALLDEIYKKNGYVR